jgi:hypothetical protein
VRSVAWRLTLVVRAVEQALPLSELEADAANNDHAEPEDAAHARRARERKGWGEGGERQQRQSGLARRARACGRARARASARTHMKTRQQATSRHLRRLSGIMPRSSSGTAPPQQGLAQQPTARAAGPVADVAGCATAVAAEPAAALIGFSAIFSSSAEAPRPAAREEARDARVE